MKKGVWILTFLLVSLVYAQDLESTAGSVILPNNSSEISYIFLVDAQDDSPIISSLVELHVVFPKETKSFDVITDNTGKFGIELGEFEKIKLEFRVNSLDTPGKDYFGIYELNENIESIEIQLFRVGDINGVVLDSLENIVPGADLKINCESRTGDEAPAKSDKYGAFEYEYAPVGECKIFANYKGSVGMYDVNVKHGEKSDVVLRLDKTIVNYNNDNYLIALIVFVLVVAFIVGIKYKPKRKPKPHSRTNDVFSTLNHKEKNVVKFLMEHKGPVSHNEVSRQVGIPKTSLCRVVQSLEKKKIMHVDKIGKYKKLSLTEWFLGKQK